MSRKPRIKIVIEPENEAEFVKMETRLHELIDSKKWISPKLGKRYMELLHPKPKKKEPLLNDPITIEFINLFRQFVKVKTIFYFRESDYWFKEGAYSLEDWLERYFSEVKQANIDVRNKKEFIIYTANHLKSYTSNLIKPISPHSMRVITGYIASQHSHITPTEENFRPKIGSYRNYNDLLSKRISEIWK